MSFNAAEYQRWYRKTYPERVQDVQRNYRATHPTKVRREARERTRNYRATRTTAQNKNAHYKYRYGITLAQYNAMYEQQAGLCAICQCPPKPGEALHLDHDHSNDKVRGLLCGDCNRALGHFRDDVDVLYRAIHYLTTR